MDDGSYKKKKTTEWFNRSIATILLTASVLGVQVIHKLSEPKDVDVKDDDLEPTIETSEAANQKFRAVDVMIVGEDWDKAVFNLFFPDGDVVELLSYKVADDVGEKIVINGADLLTFTGDVTHENVFNTTFTKEELCRRCLDGLFTWSTSKEDLDATYDGYNGINYPNEVPGAYNGHQR